MSTAASTYCDTETCEVCGQETIEGNDQLGRCVSCSLPTRLDWALRAMAAGVTRNKATGQFARIERKS